MADITSTLEVSADEVENGTILTITCRRSMTEMKSISLVKASMVISSHSNIVQ